MRRRGHPPMRRLRALLSLSAARRAWLAFALLVAAPMASAALDEGEIAPLFELPTTTRTTFRLDRPTTCPVLLVFSKPDDRHSPRTLAEIDKLLAHNDKFTSAVVRLWAVTGSPTHWRGPLPDYLPGPPWTVVLDREAQVARDYAIIATPTIYVLDTDGRLAASHPGFDPNMPHHLQRTLAALLDPELLARLDVPPAKPNMTLQLGGRLATRGLWEKAIGYYEQAAAEAPLDATALLELTQLYLEVGDVAEARATLASVPPDAATAARHQELTAEIERRAATATTSDPPSSEADR